MNYGAFNVRKWNCFRNFRWSMQFHLNCGARLWFHCCFVGKNSFDIFNFYSVLFSLIVLFRWFWVISVFLSSYLSSSVFSRWSRTHYPLVRGAVCITSKFSLFRVCTHTSYFARYTILFNANGRELPNIPKYNIHRYANSFHSDSFQETKYDKEYIEINRSINISTFRKSYIALTTTIIWIV